MSNRNWMLGSALGVALLACGVTIAQRPDHNVSAERHPNLSAAQRLAQNAYDKIVAAQQANEFDLGGHAARAKDLLGQANQELKAAAEAANRNGK